MSACTAQCVRSGAVSWRSYAVGPYLALEPRAGRGERFGRDVFVDVDGLSVLSEVVQARESSRAVALEGSFASVLTVGR
jgi:hypothetical protein